jgi:hypothetical protein
MSRRSHRVSIAWPDTLLPRLLVLVTATLALLLTGCGPDRPASRSDGMADVRVDVVPAVLSTQGIAPDFGAVVDAIEGYEVSLVREGYDQRTRTLAQPGSASFTRVGYGTWSVTVVARAEDTVVARGSAQLSVTSEEASATVQTTFLSEGEGALDLHLAHPADRGVARVEASLAPIDEPGSAEVLIMSASDDGVGWAGSRPAGTYLWIARLLDEDDVLLATVTQSVDVFGNLTSAGTVELTAADLNGPPRTPADLAAVQTWDDVELTWTDEAHVETAYEIERSHDGGSTWTVLAGVGEGTALSAGTVEYIDAELDEGAFAYRVRAVNAFGASAWSTVDIDVVLLVANDDLLDDDTWDVYPGIDVPLDASRLLANDEVRVDGGVATIVGVGDAEGGSVRLDGDQVVFTASESAVGGPASFAYTTRIDGTLVEDAAHVTIEVVREIPPVVANDDGPFQVVEGGTLQLDVSDDVLANDEAGVAPLEFLGVEATAGVTVVQNGDALDVTSTGIAGETTWFEYRVEDDLGTQATARVTFDVTLPPVEAFVYADATAFSDFTSSGYEPPTFQDVFDTWPRVSGNDYYTAPPYSGYAGDWLYATDDLDGDGAGDPRVVQPRNVWPPEGFVSPLDEALEYYTFEATLFSDDRDDDSIGLIVAFTREGGTNRYLVAHRTKGGNSPSSGWGLSLYEATSQYVLEEMSVGGTEGGWSGSSSRVRVERTGDQIVISASPWNSATIDASSEIVVDLAAGTVNGTSVSRDLSVFRGPRQYGYFTLSQPYSTYLDIVLEGGLERDVAYLLTGGSDADGDGTDDRWTGSEVWRFANGAWTQSTSETIESVLGYPRTVHVVDENGDATGVSYEILSSEVRLK